MTTVSFEKRQLELLLKVGELTSNWNLGMLCPSSIWEINSDKMCLMWIQGVWVNNSILIVEPLMYTFFQAPGDLLALSIPFSPHSPKPTAKHCLHLPSTWPKKLHWSGFCPEKYNIVVVLTEAGGEKSYKKSPKMWWGRVFRPRWQTRELCGEQSGAA